MSANTENAARRSIIAVSRQLAVSGLNHGSTGNVSQRWHRGACDGFLITPSAMAPDHLTENDIVWLLIGEGGEEGEAADGEGGEEGEAAEGRDAQPKEAAGPGVQLRTRAPSSEASLHRALYCHHAATAVVHSHAAFATTLSCLPAVQRDGIPAFHYMLAMAGGNTVRCAAYATFGTPELAKAVVAAMQDRRACLMASHGLIAIGASLSAAVNLAIEVEHLAQVYWQAMQAGSPMLLDQDQLCQVKKRFSTYGR